MKIIEQSKRKSGLERLDKLLERGNNPALRLYRDQLEAALAMPVENDGVDPERYVMELTAIRRKLRPLEKAPWNGIDANRDVAFCGTIQTRAGQNETLTVVLVEGFPQKPPEVYRIVKGVPVQVTTGIEENWSPSDNCAYAIDEAVREIERLPETNGGADETSK